MWRYNNAVEKYVQAKREAIEQEKCKKATELLAREKVFEEDGREYAKPGTSAASAAYAGYTKSDYVDGEVLFYKPVNKKIEAGIEEYKAIEEALLLEREYKEGVFSEKKDEIVEFDITPSQEFEQSSTSSIFKIVAIIIWIGGAIASFLLGTDRYGDLEFGLVLMYLAIFGFAGLFPWAISEALDYLALIARNTSGMRAKLVSQDKRTNG